MLSIGKLVACQAKYYLDQAEVRVDVVEVRLALRCLLQHCPERWPLELFWDAAAQQNEIGRAQGTTAGSCRASGPRAARAVGAGLSANSPRPASALRQARAGRGYIGLVMGLLMSWLGTEKH